MKFKALVVIGTAICMAGAAFAGEEMRTKMVIAIADGEGAEETRMELDSDELGFNLHDMQVGENRSIVDKTGRTILITRQTDSFTFNVDGETIEMPLMHSFHHGPMGMSEENVEVHVMRHPPMGMAPAMDGVMIVSAKPVDDATQQAIRSALESAGHGSEVRFVDRESGHPGPHGIRRIEKRIEVTD